MKNIFMVAILAVLSITATAQRNNIAPEIQAARDMVAVERIMLNENTDLEAVKLIKQHQVAKRRMDASIKKMPGYGKAATSKASLNKFREKNAKKDAAFKTLSDKEQETAKAKENYISSVNDTYKKNISISKTK